jgi:hypothetical protein
MFIQEGFTEWKKQNNCQIVCISHYHTINCNFHSGKCGGTKLDIDI